MPNNIRGYTMRINKILLAKLEYIATSEDRSINKQLERMIRKNISEYEKEHGEITQELIKEMKESR